MKQILLVAALLFVPAVASAQTAIVIDLGNDQALVVAFSESGEMIVVPSATIIRTDAPVENPYRQPSGSVRNTVEDLTEFNLDRGDATDIAEIYGEAADDVPAKLKRTEDLRQAIIDNGKRLNLRGKYDGLADELDDVLEELLGLDERDTTATDSRELKAVAWALWEAGR